MIEIKPCNGGMVLFGMTGAAGLAHTTKFLPCRSEFQDKRYGPGLRVHNVSGKLGAPSRCTVCGFGNGVVRP